MFSKLALSNVKKSIKDYLIYFITMAFGVCLFYVFNSIGSQKEMLKLTKSTTDILQVLASSMNYVSVFISIILALLILYANKFLIRRRKKEFGLYMVLGMDKRKISRIVILETLFIGAFALVAGLIAGIFASQGLAVLTAKLMEVQLKQFKFTFSGDAALKSVIYFGIIFVIVMIFNTISISRYKLIDLLTAGRKNEKNRTPKVWVSVILFVIAVGLIGYAYHCLYGIMDSLDIKVFGKCIICGAVGTFLFFYSVSGFLLRIVQSSKRLYYRGLNMFVVRQLSSKISSTFISMTLISLMLLVAIATMGAGLGFSKTLTAKNAKLAPCEGTITFTAKNDKKECGDAIKALKECGVDTDKYIANSCQYMTYQTKKLKYKQFMLKKDTEGTYGDMGGIPVEVMKVSDYNRVQRYLGKEPIQVNDDQYTILSTVNICNETFGRTLDNKVKVNAFGTTLTATGKISEYSTCVEMVGSTTGIVILPDKYVTGKDFVPYLVNLDYNYKDKSEDADLDFYQMTNKKMAKQKDYKENLEWYTLLTVSTIKTAQGGIRVMASFFIIYVGIVFLISCAAILALQQLTESSDNAERYKLLRKLGVEGKMMRRALFTQMAIYFMVPLAVAVIHSAVAIDFSMKIIKLFGETGVASNSLMVAGFVLLIYGGYFVATYIAGKGIIKES